MPKLSERCLSLLNPLVRMGYPRLGILSTHILDNLTNPHSDPWSGYPIREDSVTYLVGYLGYRFRGQQVSESAGHSLPDTGHGARLDHAAAGLLCDPGPGRCFRDRKA
jgi:hypothetical protein